MPGMDTRASTRRLWVLEHVNTRQFIGRFDGRWTRTGDLDVAALFASPGEAENALQALLQEAYDRIHQTTPRAIPMWWDLAGGRVVVSEVEQITRLVARE